MYEKHLWYEKLLINYLRIIMLRHYATKLNCQALLILKSNGQIQRH